MNFCNYFYSISIFVVFLSIFGSVGALKTTRKSDDVIVNEIKDKLDHFVNKSKVDSKSHGLLTGQKGQSVYTDLDTWEAPHDIQKNYPYYFSGYDYEKRPVWIIESGLWDWRKIVESGPETINIFDKYMSQVSHRMSKSFQNLGTAEDPIKGITLISDLANFDVHQLSSLSMVTYHVKTMSTFAPWLMHDVEVIICLNTNAVANTLINLLKPSLGTVFEKFQIYGTVKEKWLPHLLRIIPRSQLPPWYTGRKDPNWKPVQVYG